jgi:predicted transcriptional regulator
MPLGILDDDDFERELSSLGKPRAEQAKVVNINDGKGRGHKEEVPEAIREIVAEEKLEGAKSKDLAKLFNVSESSISAYAKGATSTATYHQPDEQLGKHVRSVRSRISKQANRVLRQSLATITEEKLAELSPVKASAVARDMASIVKVMSDDEGDGEGKTINNTIFYAPRLMREDEFEYLEVDDNGMVTQRRSP